MHRWRTTALVAVTLGIALPAAVLPATASPSAPAATLPSTSSSAAASLTPAAVARPVLSPLTFGTHTFGPADIKAQRQLVGSVRTPTAQWEWVESAPGRFSWGAVDGQMASARDRGVAQVLFVLGRTPAWAAGPNTSKDPTSPTHANPPRSVADWGAYVRALATHLKSVMAAYPQTTVAFQIWNEASLTTFFNGTPEQMAALTKRAYTEIKAVLPQAPVVAASTTMRLPANYKLFFPRYLTALRKLGWPVDAFSVHTYPPGTGGPLDYIGYLRQVKRDLAAAGTRKPLWVTEMNYGIKGPGGAYPHVSITGAKAQSWYARVYLDALRLGIPRVYWYAQLEDEPSLGIRMWSGTPAMRASRTLYGWLVGHRWLGCSAPGAVVRCRTAKGASAHVIMWSQGAPRTVTVPPGMRKRCDLERRCITVRPGKAVRVNGVVTRFSA